MLACAWKISSRYRPRYRGRYQRALWSVQLLNASYRTGKANSKPFRCDLRPLHRSMIFLQNKFCALTRDNLKRKTDQRKNFEYHENIISQSTFIF